MGGRGSSVMPGGIQGRGRCSRSGAPPRSRGRERASGARLRVALAPRMVVCPDGRSSYAARGRRVNPDGFLRDVLVAPERLEALLDAYERSGSPLAALLPRARGDDRHPVPGSRRSERRTARRDGGGRARCSRALAAPRRCGRPHPRRSMTGPISRATPVAQSRRTPGSRRRSTGRPASSAHRREPFRTEVCSFASSGCTSSRRSPLISLDTSAASS